MTTPTMNTETDLKQVEKAPSRVAGATLRLFTCMVGNIFSSPKDAKNGEEDSPISEAQWNRGSPQDPVHHEPTEASLKKSEQATAMTDVSEKDQEGSASESDTERNTTAPNSPISSSEESGSASEKEEPKIRRGERRLLCPLSIKFSQARVRPNFQDGREVDDASAIVDPVPFAEAWATMGTGGEGANPAEPPSHLEDEYDEFLAHPFPTIEVIRWRSKARAPDGKELKDPQTGKDVMNEEQWFTLDNRRLYALQKAAIRQWPKRCCVVVRVLRGDFGHALKKFKTISDGRTVEVGHRFWDKETQASNFTWSWEAMVECLEAPPADPAREEALLNVIKRDEKRPNECALPRAGGCEHLLALPKYKDHGVPAGLASEVSNFKLPAPSKNGSEKPGNNSRRFEYWLAAKEGCKAPPARKTTIPKKQEEEPVFSAPKSPNTAMADKIAAMARHNQKQNQVGVASPGAGKVLDLLSVMNKKKTAEMEIPSGADSDTTASSGGEKSPDGLRKSKLAPRIATEEKRADKRRQRARNARGWVATAA